MNRINRKKKFLKEAMEKTHGVVMNMDEVSRRFIANFVGIENAEFHSPEELSKALYYKGSLVQKFLEVYN